MKKLLLMVTLTSVLASLNTAARAADGDDDFIEIPFIAKLSG